MSFISQEEIDEAERKELERAKERLLAQNAGLSRKNKSFKDDVDLSTFDEGLFSKKSDKKYQYIIFIILIMLLAATVMWFFFKNKYIDENTTLKNNNIETTP